MTISFGIFVNKPQQTLIGLEFSENAFHWLKHKAPSCDVFF